jgi:hypothetical protein
MKKFFLLATAFTLSLGLSAQEADANAAEISFETETIDYGTIDKGADGQREFVFTNTGKEPLIISNCKGSCGCTVPVWPKQPIAPGETASIKVKYDTKRVGQFTKTVTVSSNAKSPTKTLRIRGVVKAAPKETETVPMKKESGSSAIQVR